MSFVGRYDPSHQLFVDNNILKFPYIHKYFLFMLMFKFVHLGYCSNVFTLSQPRAHYNLRNILNNVNIPIWRKTLCRMSPVYLGPVIWNEMDQNFKSINTISAFKRNCKSLLLENQRTR